ncbi:hypothetical protein ACVWZZ_002327 [Bradyrhizobium sp. LM6.10]|jgi:hypothetical protein
MLRLNIASNTSKLNALSWLLRSAGTSTGNLLRSVSAMTVISLSASARTRSKVSFSSELSSKLTPISGRLGAHA